MTEEERQQRERQTIELASKLVTYYESNRGAGHSTALFGDSDRKPILLVKEDRQKLEMAMLSNGKSKNKYEVMSIHDITVAGKLAGKRQPLVIDHFVLTGMFVGLLNAINRRDTDLSSLRRRVNNAEADKCGIVRAKDAAIKERDEHKAKLDAYAKMTFWQRVKFVFTGKFNADTARTETNEE